MKLLDMLAPTYVQMLGALSAWLDKAEAQIRDDRAGSLLLARLAPDMFPLATQIRFACVQAQEGMLRLHDQAFPPELTELLNEGRNAAERPGTLAQAQARIRETLDRVQAIAGEGSPIK